MPVYTIKNLGQGQLGTSPAGDLYTVPTATSAIVKTITVVNTDTVARIVNLYIKVSGQTARKIIPVNTILPAGYSLETDEEFTISAADKIQGDADAASKLDYTLSGVEQS